jgi:Arc/MetJ-type ribon-helix-helix transcriptional regulator
MDGKKPNLSGILKAVQAKLEEHGIEIDLAGAVASAAGGGEGAGPRVKVVCIAPDLKDSVEELGQSSRDKVLMVRVDEETSVALDAWVETGAVKSRSEAAALFIREGLKVRQAELDRLSAALKDVEKAKEKLREKAREVFGGKAGE